MNQGKRFKDTRAIVTDIFEAHPEWNARQVYDRYLILLGDPNKKAVTLNAIQKHLEVIKVPYQKMQETGIDNPWTLIDATIPIESLPVIVECQRHLNKGWWKRDDIRFLTVRQAKWISKIYPLLKRVAIRNNDKIDIYDRKADIENIMPWLFLIASVYAKHERISELLDIPFDCSLFDTLFFTTDQFFKADVGVKIRQLDNFLDNDLIQNTFKNVMDKDGAK